MTVSTQTRLAIVGCGRAAGATSSVGASGMSVSHIEALQQMIGVSVVAAFDNDPGARRRYCERWGVPATGSWEDLVALDPDALLIASSTATHEDYLRSAADAGIKLVVCEKPLVESAAAARDIAQLYRTAGKTLRVYYPRRWVSEISDLQAECRSGELGELLGGHVWYGNGIRNIGVHAIDLLLRFCGRIDSVAAATQQPENSPPSQDPTPDLVIMLSTGQLIMMQSYDYDRYALFEIDLLFSSGRIRISDLGFSTERWARGESPHYQGFAELVNHTRTATDYGNAACNFWKTTLQTFLAGADVVDDGDSEILDVVDAAILATRSGVTCRVGACN